MKIEPLDVVKNYAADLIEQRQIAADDIEWDPPKGTKVRPSATARGSRLTKKVKDVVEVDDSAEEVEEVPARSGLKRKRAEIASTPSPVKEGSKRRDRVAASKQDVDLSHETVNEDDEIAGLVPEAEGLVCVNVLYHLLSLICFVDLRVLQLQGERRLRRDLESLEQEVVCYLPELPSVEEGMLLPEQEVVYHGMADRSSVGARQGSPGKCCCYS